MEYINRYLNKDIDDTFTDENLYIIIKIAIILTIVSIYLPLTSEMIDKFLDWEYINKTCKKDKPDEPYYVNGKISEKWKRYNKCMMKQNIIEEKYFNDKFYLNIKVSLISILISLFIIFYQNKENYLTINFLGFLFGALLLFTSNILKKWHDISVNSKVIILLTLYILIIHGTSYFDLILIQ